jgi:hypothetical protein
MTKKYSVTGKASLDFHKGAIYGLEMAAAVIEERPLTLESVAICHILRGWAEYVEKRIQAE